MSPRTRALAPAAPVCLLAGLALAAMACSVDHGLDLEPWRDGGVGVLRQAVAGQWETAGLMVTARDGHTTTLLPSGKVLAAGGYSGSAYLTTAELYDPALGTWTSTGSFVSGRYSHTATLLPSGKVLIAGGYGSSGYLARAELYDPALGSWSATGTMATARIAHTATLLGSGKVLVAGGYNTLGYTASAELYDPTSGTWTTTAPLATAREYHSATLLDSGKVLVAGGTGAAVCASTELYDPSLGTWSSTAALATARFAHSATPLPSGLVLVAGGSGSSTTVSSAELYDPALNTWSGTGALLTARNFHRANLLPTGKVLASAGRAAIYSAYATAELYDPTAGTWTATGSLATAREGHVTVVLPSGKVLASGGANASTYPLRSAELYDSGQAAGCRVCGDDGACVTLAAGVACGTCKACDGAGSCNFSPNGTSCGLCSQCDGSGACSVVPADDTACGPIPCSNLTTTCRTYSMITTNRCLSLGACKPWNDAATCTVYTDTASGTDCGLCRACDGVGACAQTPADDSTCGTIACANLGPQSPYRGCRTFSNLTSDRCASFGVCKTATATYCTTYTDELFGTECVAAYCSGSVLYRADTCGTGASSGLCNDSGSVDCSPYGCTSGACRTICITNADCVSGGYCDLGRCFLKKAQGGTCDRTDQCQSGNCADGVCCNTDCNGVCQACNVPGLVGTCTPTAAGTDPKGECSTAGSCGGTCNGMGACVAANPGEPCGTCKTCNSSGQCVPVTNGTSCEGALYCVTGETCQDGVCGGGTPVDCDDGDPCTNDACSETLKRCQNTTLSDGTPCGTGDKCVASTCQAGTCTGGGALDCDDGNPCTYDTCNPSTGCVHTPTAASCDDGDPCTTDDTCENGTCVGTLVPSCQSDGGAHADAGGQGDAGGGGSDAGGAGHDAGTEEGDGSGCGCHSATPRGSASLLLLAFVVPLIRRRR
jgi:hypothetical protein